MKRHDLEEVIACLPAGRTLFTYGKDLYAAQLLSYYLQPKPQTIQHLKQSHLAGLLEKPAIRNHFGNLGRSLVCSEDLVWFCPNEVTSFRLTLGRYHGLQTSRKAGKGCNLVLQLNQNTRDNRFVSRAFPNRDDDPFEFHCHPIHEGPHRTLAWARIDFDLNSGEALIEEIQNDRIRESRYWLEYLRRRKMKTYKGRWFTLHRDWMERYWKEFMEPASRIWDEAMLSATIRFIREELGLPRIFFHSPETNCHYKKGGAEDAPRSVYTRLPKRFCFRPSTDLPEFLPRKRRAAKARFHILEV